MGSTPTVSIFIKFIIGVVGREPTQGKALSVVRARSEQRAKPILLVVKTTKAKCVVPFNANDSRQSLWSQIKKTSKKEVFFIVFGRDSQPVF